MSRVTSGVTTHRRHKKITDQAKGYYGRRKNTFKVATQAVDKANQYDVTELLNFPHSLLKSETSSFLNVSCNPLSARTTIS